MLWHGRSAQKATSIRVLMTESRILGTNFAQLEAHDEQLLRLGMLAERYFPDDPNTSLLKLRQLAELLAQHVAANVGEYESTGEPSTI